MQNARAPDTCKAAPCEIHSWKTLGVWMSLANGPCIFSVAALLAMDVDAAGTAWPPPVQLPNQTISDEVLTLAGRGAGGDGGDIEMGASPGTPVPISSREVSFGPQKGVSREQSKRVSREQSTGKGLWGKVARELSRISSQKTEKTSGSSMQEAEWDVFISYRVRADMKFVENLYWQLSSTEITDHASTRKLRVFWDKGDACTMPPCLCDSDVCICASVHLLLPQ